MCWFVVSELWCTRGLGCDTLSGRHGPALMSGPDYDIQGGVACPDAPSECAAPQPAPGHLCRGTPRSPLRPRALGPSVSVIQLPAAPTLQWYSETISCTQKPGGTPVAPLPGSPK